MRAAPFAGILVLDIGRGLESVGRAAHAALRRRGFSFWNGHGYAPLHGQNAPATLAKGPHRGHNLRKSGAYTRLAPFWPALRRIFLSPRRFTLIQTTHIRSGPARSSLDQVGEPPQPRAGPGRIACDRIGQADGEQRRLPA